MSHPIPRATVAELLNPASVAVIGASEDQGKFGGRVLRMLLKHDFGGAVYPINPNRAELFGIKTFPDIAATPEPADIVVMAIPQPKVRGAIADAARAGVKGAVIITNKFADAGPEGAAEEAAIVGIARRHGMRLIGPNCLGVISPANKLVLCSSPALEVDRLPQSPIGFISQSGALMATIFDRAQGRGIGFSHAVSIGNQADLELADFIDFLIDDPATSVICSYVEGVKSPERYLALAERARAAGKPWLIVKAGRTADGARAAFSHTASIAGAYRCFAEISKAHGVVLLADVDAMIVLAAGLVRFPGKRARSSVIVTTSGGGGALAADRLTDFGVPLTRFADATLARLGEHYAPEQAANPIDLGGRREGEAIGIVRETVAAVSGDPAEDAFLFTLTTAPVLAKTTAGLADAALEGGKPCIFHLQPGPAADASRAELVARQVPFADSLDEAVRALAGWRDWSTQTADLAPQRPAGLPAALPLPAGAHRLDEAATKQLLSAYGVPVNRGAFAGSPEEAGRIAETLGYPVVVKAVAPEASHKSEIGGVILGLRSRDEVQSAARRIGESAARQQPTAWVEGFMVQAELSGEVELLVGSIHDPQFGPFVVVGAGGAWVELLNDTALAPAPVSAETAERLLRRLRIARRLDGGRGRPPADIAAAVDAIVRVSWLAYDAGARIAELDINPLLVGAQGAGAIAVDGRARLNGDV